MIATHNSGTGERSGGFMSWLSIPFSRCQNKTLWNQYNFGARLFDLRVRKIKGEWYFAHGLWRSKRTVKAALESLSLLAIACGEKANIIVTYEGMCKDKVEFIKYINNLVSIYPGLALAEINVKKPKWQCLKRYKCFPFKQCFAVIKGWKCLLPIPWIWHKIRKIERTQSSTVYNMIDFL